MGLALMVLSHPASASIVSPIQSTAQPFGLTAVAPVQLAGSDAAAANFMQSLASINAYIKQTLPEYTALKTPSSMALDPSALRLGADSSVRAYFISEGAAYHSTLGFNTFGANAAIPTASTPGITADAKLIFPDASSTDPTTLNPNGNSIRTTNDPLLAGDFVNLGNYKAGTLLDFFLVPYGATGGTSVLTDEAARNPDKLQHIVSFNANGKSYMVLSFEDALNGGDKDYNDVIFALEISTNAPEPRTWAGLAIFGIFVGLSSRRKARDRSR